MSLEKPEYTVLTGPTPFYTQEDLGNIFGKAKSESGLKLDSYGQVDELALGLEAGDVVEIIEEMRDNLLKVKIPGFKDDFYTDARFLSERKTTHELPIHTRPSKEKIIENLRASVGVPYIWGGTNPAGYPQLLEWYPPSAPLSEELQAKWTGAGFDCSGLLFAATNRTVPRNTSGLCTFGEPVNIENLTPDEIIPLLQPLDIIVWPRHVMIVLNENEVIESRLWEDSEGKPLPSSVDIRATREVLEKTMERRRPVDKISEDKEEAKKQFVIRRWF